MRDTAVPDGALFPLQTRAVEENAIESMRDPGFVAGTSLLSDPWRHLNRTLWPIADAGMLMLTFLYSGAAAVPPERPLQA
jgi:hypothetical protein